MGNAYIVLPQICSENYLPNFIRIAIFFKENIAKTFGLFSEDSVLSDNVCVNNDQNTVYS